MRARRAASALLTVMSFGAIQQKGKGTPAHSPERNGSLLVRKERAQETAYVSGGVPTAMTAKKKVEITLLPPRLVPLSAEQEEEAVRLLADLLLDASRKRQAEHSRPAED